MFSLASKVNRSTMDLRAPVSSIMTTKLLTVGPQDKLNQVKEIFDKNRIHHVPVVRYRQILGIISKTDFLHFLHGIRGSNYDKMIESTRLNRYTAEEIMTTGLAKLEPTDKINVALEVFKENLFHAIPIVENNNLVGMLTTFDIIRKLAEEDDVGRHK
jgi:acetoin utilization protein AcuB